LVDALNPLPSNPQESYVYDSVGNRTNSNQNGASTFNSANQLTEDANFTYQYDNNGNVTRKTAKAGGAVTTYEYDAENKLVRVVSPSNTVNYRYDGSGRRVEKEVIAGTTTVTRYVYGNEDILLELNGSNTITARYTHGPGIDEPLIVEKNSQSFYYHADGLGSITEMTNQAGAVAQRYTYSSFGKIESQLDPNFVQPYTFTSREFDGETGLYYYRARQYDTATGRFTQIDPVLSAGNTFTLYLFPSLVDQPARLHPFVYVGNNPTVFIDPNGAFWDAVKSLREVVRDIMRLYRCYQCAEKMEKLTKAIDECNEELAKCKELIDIARFMDKYNLHTSVQPNSIAFRRKCLLRIEVRSSVVSSVGAQCRSSKLNAMTKSVWLMVVGVICGLLLGVVVTTIVQNKSYDGQSLALTMQGNDYLQKKQFDQALSMFHQSLAYAPDEYGPHVGLGEAYEGLGISDVALREFRTAIQLIDLRKENEVSQLIEKVVILSRIGDIYQQIGKQEEAIKSYKQGIALSPKWPDPYFGLGIIYHKNGHFELAKESLTKYLQYETREKRVDDKKAAENLLANIDREKHK